MLGLETAGLGDRCIIQEPHPENSLTKCFVFLESPGAEDLCARIK
jgi:hypothetical protein